MPDKERSPHFPTLSELYPRVEYIPAVTAAEIAPAIAADQPPAPTGEADRAKAAEQERVTLKGRVGKTPTFWLTRNNVPKAKFPVGVRDETNPDKTVWRDVLAFRQRAIYARDQLQVGDSVEVIGYQRERTVEGTRGPRSVVEVTAAVIKRRS